MVNGVRWMPRKALTTPTVRPRARSGTTAAEKGARRRSRSRAVPGSSTAATASDAEDSISTGVISRIAWAR